MGSKCARHCGSKSTAMSYSLIIITCCCHDCSMVKILQQALPRQAAIARRTNSAYLQLTAPCNSINDALTHERPRTVHSFTTAVKKRPNASGLSQPALSKQTLTNTTAVTDHGYHRRATEGKKRDWQSQAMQGAAVNNPAVVSWLRSVSDSCCDPMLQGHSVGAK